MALEHIFGKYFMLFRIYWDQNSFAKNMFVLRLILLNWQKYLCFVRMMWAAGSLASVSMITYPAISALVSCSAEADQQGMTSYLPQSHSTRAHTRIHARTRTYSANTHTVTHTHNAHARAHNATGFYQVQFIQKDRCRKWVPANVLRAIPKNARKVSYNWLPTALMSNTVLNLSANEDQLTLHFSLFSIVCLC